MNFRTALLSAAAGLWLSLAWLPALVESKAILGVDLGSLYMKVALVQRGAPLEIVTNLHSKRKTENMILFDSGTRFYGADASSLLARKPLKTPSQMSIMLGRDGDHPAVQVLSERHYPIVPSYNESRSGPALTVDGQQFTPEELVAMVLTHARDMTVAYAAEQGKEAAPPKDCVLTVPAFATVHERKALLDAAELADFNVLGLLEENTASALHFAMDKQYPEPKTFLFYNMGGSAVQVSIVKLFSYNMTKTKTVGALEVLSKAWDATVGGQSFDHRIVEYLADQFNTQWDKKRGDGQKKDIRDIPRALTKLRLQANKVKHVLSANTEIPIYMESLHDDTPLSTHLTRAHFEELAHDLIERAIKPIHTALDVANMTLSDIDEIELIGGGMRIPRIQTLMKKALNNKELGLHINADESMALGAAFHGANLSTAFRVRHVGLTDINPFPISISLEDLEEKSRGFFGGKKNKKEEDGVEVWSKHATILKAFGKLGVKKTIAFTHDKDVHCALDYDESDVLPEGTGLAIERYNVTGIETFAKEMDEKKLGKPKVSLQFELTHSGITRLIKAEASVEELYTVEEEVEVDDQDGDNSTETNSTEDVNAGDAKEAEDRKLEDETTDATAADNATSSNETDSATAANDTTSEKTSQKKKKKTVLQEKEKKRVHKRALTVQTYSVGKIKQYTPELLEESKNKLLELARVDKERMLLEESKNKVESYIYHIKNKLSDDEEAINKVSTEEQRAEILKLAEAAEEWMYEDGANADLATTEDKYAELSTPAEKIFFRRAEMTDRPEAIEALQGRLKKVEELMKKWETTMPQVTEEERAEVLSKVEEVRKWVSEKEEAQSKKAPHEDPEFTSAEVPLQTAPIEVLVARLKRKPKPKPVKNETATNATDANATDTNATAEDASSENATADAGSAKEDTDSTTKEDEEEKVADEL